ncbi:hypothetical protein WA577_004794 [Blastocystis sp. JDR]
MEQREVVDFSSIISCLCPLSFSKVRDPVRGPHCHHIRFFDRDSFVELYGATGVGPCPLCLKETRIDELVEDPYILTLLRATDEDAEFISITQEYSFDSSLYSGVSDELKTGRTVPFPSESDVYLSGRVSQRYKTEDNRYLPIPQATSSFSRVFFYKRIEAERMQRIEQTLEMKYWDYLEFYMSVLSKAIHLSSTDAFNPYIVFHNVNVQQINAIQEVVDTVNVYCLAVGSEMLVVISQEYYPSDEEENDLVMRRYGFDDFIQKHSHSVL